MEGAMIATEFVKIDSLAAYCPPSCLCLDKVLGSDSCCICLHTMGKYATHHIKPW